MELRLTHTHAYIYNQSSALDLISSGNTDTKIAIVMLCYENDHGYTEKSLKGCFKGEYMFRE